jgi:hypothetical protein
VTFGLIASAGIFALAFIAGPVRGIPWFWTLVDCSFGIACGIRCWCAAATSASSRRWHNDPVPRSDDLYSLPPTCRYRSTTAAARI